MDIWLGILISITLIVLFKLYMQGQMKYWYGPENMKNNKHTRIRHIR